METLKNRHSVLNPGGFNTLLRSIIQSTQNFPGLISGQWAIQVLNASCIPSSFPPEMCCWLLTSTSTRRWLVGNQVMVGNWEIWLRLVSELIDRGHAWRWFVKWRPGIIWRFQLYTHYFLTGGLGSHGQQVHKPLRLIEKLHLYIFSGEYPLFSLYSQRA